MASDIIELLGFVAVAFAVVLLAKIVRDKVLSLAGYELNDLISAKDNVAAATEQTGYLFGVVLGFLGAIVVPSDAQGFIAIAEAIAIAGCLTILLQLAADFLSDKLIFRGLQDRIEIFQNGNLALALGKAAVSIATGLMIQGSLSDADSTILACIVWFVIGQLIMVVACLIYQKLTPYDDLAEISSGNIAASLPIVGIILASGLIMEGAMRGGYESFADDGIAILQYSGVSLVMVFVIRIFTDRLLLPKSNLSDEIVQDKNVGAGLLEGASFVIAALIVSYFLT